MKGWKRFPLFQRDSYTLISSVLVLFLLLNLLAPVSAESTIETFNDDSCQSAYRGLDGPDGYDGTCTQLRREGNFSSFHVSHLSAGCAITIYGPDSVVGQPCSDTGAIVAQIGTCYNNTWVYYSIDECSAQAPGANNSHVGQIVGGVVGGVAGVALISGLLAWFFFRKRRQNKTQISDVPATAPETYQTYDQNQVQMQRPLQHTFVELATPQTTDKPMQHHELHGSSVMELQDSQVGSKPK